MDNKHNTECERSNFSLTQSIRYQIIIAGRPSENWTDWVEIFEIQIETDSLGLVTTTLTGAVDQAGLIGMLRQLYSLGYPLMSVNCIQMQNN